MKKKDYVDFFVAVNGNDAWSGKLDKPNGKRTDGPFATLERARHAIRELKHHRKSAEPMRVTVREGTYYLSAPLIFEPEDSGTPEQPAVYMNYPDEKPILSGGRKITGWKSAADNIWQAEVPDVKKGTWYFRQLFVNGNRRCRARLPYEGEYFPVADQVISANVKDPGNHLGFKCNPEHIRQWKNADDIEIVVLHNFDISRHTVAEVDENNSMVTLAQPAFWPITKGRRYFMDNVFEGLQAPGTWRLDRKAGMLYYRPLPGEHMHNAEVLAPVIRELVSFRGDIENGRPVQSIALRGFTLCHADWTLPPEGFSGYQAAYDIPAAISARGAMACSLEENEIRQIGTYAIEFGRACKHNRIVNNHIHDTGAGGIKIGEPENRPADSDETCHNTIADNHIHDGGKIYLGAVGIWIGQSGSNLVAHNEIHDLYYTGISAGWNWKPGWNRSRNNIIEYNHIHHVMRHTLTDGGGIYLLGLSPGTIVRCNLIHDIHGYRHKGRGIYLDASVMGVVVENNIVHHVQGASLRLQKGTTGNFIVNNIFALAEQLQLGFDSYRPNVFLHNIIYWKTGKLFGRDAWESYDVIMDHNLYYDASGRHPQFLAFTFKEWQKKCPPLSALPADINWSTFSPADKKDELIVVGLDRNSMIADPLFVDPEKGDFSLRPESPAFKTGFKPFDLRDAGPRP